MPVIHFGEDPFATPSAERDPARRFRGRLVAPVTGWTARTADGRPIGIAVSSIMVTTGQPPAIVGLIDPLSEFWDALVESKRFVVHVLEREHRRLANQLAGKYGPDSRFDDATTLDSPWGPVIEQAGTRAFCTLGGLREMGESVLVRGDVDEFALPEGPLDPLGYFRGSYCDVLAQGPAPD